MVKIAPAAAIDKSSSRARNCSYAFNVAPGQKSRRNQGLAALPARQITHNQPGAPAIHDCSASCGIVAEVRLLYILFSPGVLYLELDANPALATFTLLYLSSSLSYATAAQASLPVAAGTKCQQSREKGSWTSATVKVSPNVY